MLRTQPAVERFTSHASRLIRCRYEQHLRAVLGWPLGDSSLTVGAAIMLNVLGEADGDDGMRRAHQLMGRAYQVRCTGVYRHEAEGCLEEGSSGLKQNLHLQRTRQYGVF